MLTTCRLAIALCGVLPLSAAAALAQDGAAAPKPGTRRELTVKGVAVGVRWCPSGSFLMGSPAAEPERAKDEAQHQVTLTRGFWIMETEITQALYTAVAGSCTPKFTGADLPVERVTWYDAVDFCNRFDAAAGLPPAYRIEREAKDPANDLDGKNDPLKWTVTAIPDADGFRLPTEAQWEYACRAGTTTPFSCGDTIDTERANFNGGNPYNGAAKGRYLEKTTAVGSYAANPWGLVDMHGNVWEWCWDRYGPYADGPQTDPAGAGSGGLRVLRGGCWHYRASYLRSAARYKDRPSRSWDLLGLRLVAPEGVLRTP